MALMYHGSAQGGVIAVACPLACCALESTRPLEGLTMNDTAARYDRRAEDIGNIVEFGHLNIRVPDQQRAVLFYVMGLGLTRDPYLVTGIDNAWINVGTCQFHLPVGPAQVLRGATGLVMADLDGLMNRLAAIEPRLEDTQFTFARAGAQVNVTCPWGNRIRVHAPDASRFGSMTLGMPYVEIDARPGTAAGIARFYTQVLDAPAQSGEDASGVFARVPAGLGESLVFREKRGAEAPYDGHHIQIAVADRKSTRLNSSHVSQSRMPSSA